ncbi:MAG: hypothetical protein AB1641_00890 [Thermodesulfobacteriota bacterium]
MTRRKTLTLALLAAGVILMTAAATDFSLTRPATVLTEREGDAPLTLKAGVFPGPYGRSLLLGLTGVMLSAAGLYGLIRSSPRGELTALTRRELLNSKEDNPDYYRELGRRFQGEGFLSDAVDFLAKAGDAAGLEALAQAAIEEGDLFLLTKSRKALGRLPEPEELARLADNATRLGKTSFAESARRQHQTSGASSAETANG